MKLQKSARNPKMVTGLFKDSKSVDRAYDSVAKRGYGTGDINVVMSDDTRKRYFSDDRHIKNERGSKAAEGGDLGGPIGGTIGTLIPVLVAAGAFLAFPVLGWLSPDRWPYRGPALAPLAWPLALLERLSTGASRKSAPDNTKRVSMTAAF